MGVNKGTRSSVLALLVGLSTTALLATVQPQVIAGSAPDLLCELVLLPGKVIAGVFPNRGTASPEFLAFTYLATFLLSGGATYFVLTRKREKSTSRS